MQILKTTNLKAFARSQKIGPEHTLDILEEKRLIGRGGAGYPVHKKWRFAKDTPSEERFVICNADEGEPGTFKDRMILEKNPETLIEGILIAAYVINASRCFIYLRGEYAFLRDRLEKTISQVISKAKATTSIEIVIGAGSYVCGEETAIIQSIEGYRGQPYTKPPFPTVEGLFGKPTVINNVETLTNVAQAILFDDWNPDLRLFSVSGNVLSPGVFELPIGTKLSAVLKKAKPDGKPKAVYYGAFGGCMPAVDMELTSENICKEKCAHGAFTIIVVNEKSSIVRLAYIISKFFTYESCGKCTPCREGTVQVMLILKKLAAGNGEKADLELLMELATHIKETSLCGLGQSSMNHILTGLEHFESEFKEALR